MWGFRSRSPWPRPAARTCIDVSPDAVGASLAGDSYISDVAVREARAARRRRRSRGDYRPSPIGDCDDIVICVPTPLSGTASRTSRRDRRDRGDRRAPARGPPRRAGVDDLPGDDARRLAAALEQASGLVAGVDFHLAMSPERIDPGRADYTMRTTPKVVGGLTPPAPSAPARSTSRPSTRSCRSRRPRRPSSRSCSRTSSAPSTSRS